MLHYLYFSYKVLVKKVQFDVQWIELHLCLKLPLRFDSDDDDDDDDYISTVRYSDGQLTKKIN